MLVINHGAFVTFGEVSDPFQSYHIGFLPSRVILVPNIFKCILKESRAEDKNLDAVEFPMSGGERLGNKRGDW